MRTAERAGDLASDSVAGDAAPVAARMRAALTGGGTGGNERLTSMAGALLIVLLALLGVTILLIGQLIWLHLFLGLVLLGPLGVKLASTGYRFVRYYTHSQSYLAKGPPGRIMRLLAPIVVVSTLVVFGTGVALLIAGPRGRDQYLLLHKASFVVWLGVTGLHVLGRLPVMIRSLGGADLDAELRGSAPGAPGRWITLAGALIGGLLLAIVLIPQFAPWTTPAALLHHDH